MLEATESTRSLQWTAPAARQTATIMSIATEVPGAQVYAVEDSPDALPFLRRNVEAEAAHVVVVEGDVRKLTTLEALNGSVDVVISNPPYVPEAASVAPEVGHDPAGAVFAGVDGLAVAGLLEGVDEAGHGVRLRGRPARPQRLLPPAGHARCGRAATAAAGVVVATARAEQERTGRDQADRRCTPLEPHRNPPQVWPTPRGGGLVGSAGSHRRGRN